MMIVEKMIDKEMMFDDDKQRESNPGSRQDIGAKMMIDVLRPLLCTWQAKWAERPPKVMR